LGSARGRITVITRPDVIRMSATYEA